MNRIFKSVFISLLFIIHCSLALSDQFPFNPGETITYDIKKFGLTAGEAELIFRGKVQINNQEALLITFTAKALNFFDEEKIYVDAKTFYPVIIERNLNLWGKKEIISEQYDHQRGSIKITKKSGGKISETVIQKQGPIDNIYGFIYRYRKDGQNKKGEKFEMRLPTKDVQFKLVGEVKMNASNKEFEAYSLESTPKNYTVWFGKEQGRIPLKIDGALNLGKTSLVMKKYKKE